MKKKFLLSISLLLFAIQGLLFAQDPIITITQVDTAFALTGMPLQPVIKIKINNPTASSMTLQKVVVKSLNQDDTDIDSIALFYTVNNRFSLADYPSDVQIQIGNKLKLSGDTAVFSGFSFALDPGDNYIWVMMDVASLARPSHTLDASIRPGGIEIDNNFFPASIQSPTGSIPIKSVYYRCNFETFDNNNKPKDWTQTPEAGAGNWYGFYGGFGVTAPDNAYAPRIHYPDGHPGEPKSGKGNVTLKLQSSIPKSNMLISPPIDLSLAIKSNLIFYHSQVNRCKDELCTDIINDELEVYYQVGATNPANWILLNKYQLGTDNVWLKQTILLPDATTQKNVYIGFKGTTKGAWGVCLDSMIIHEVGTANRQVKSVDIVRPMSKYVAQGTNKNPILRTNIRVSGNTNTISLNSLTISTKNQNDADVVSGSVRLYSTLDSVFFSPVQVGTNQSISGSHTVAFSGLNETIETGDNYFWLTYDITPGATPDDTLSASINANDIVLSTETWPVAAITPTGSRKIKQAIFFDNFETDKGWDMSVGDFQRQSPTGLGGNKGRPDPTYSYDGSNVLGNDLSGLGSYAGDYEPNSRSLALSPLISGKYFKNIHLDFSRWLNVENVDSACVEFKYAGSNTWENIWLNSSTIVDTKWHEHSFDLTKKINRKDFNLRFRLGTTNSLANFSGWNVDYLFVTGDSIKWDAAVTKILAPLTSCDLSASEKIKVRIKNTGPKPISNFPLKFSKDGGKTFISETVANTIAVGDSLDYLSSTTLDFSKPAVYNVMVKVALAGDNYPENDTTLTQIIALPTYHLPYQTGFEEDTVFWASGGVLPSWKLKGPNNNYIKTPGEGIKSWITEGETGKYNLYEKSHVVSPCYIFDTNTLPIVDFNSNYYTVNKYDGVILQYSLNQGATWQYVAKDAYTFNWNWYNDTIKAFKGIPGWTDRTKNLAGNQIWMRQKQVLPLATVGPKVRFRIALKSDSSSTYTADGFAFDDFKLYNAPVDVGVTSIDNLVTPSCQFGTNSNPDKLKVTVKNFGIRDIQATDSIIIGIKVNQSAIISEKFILGSILAKGTDRQFTMTKSVNLQAIGNYTIKVFTRNESDPNFYGPGRGAANDTSIISITVNSNPVTGLKDTVYTNRPNKAIIQAIDSAYFSYIWKYPPIPALDEHNALLKVKNTGLGRHRLTVTNNNTGCVTKDSTYVKLLISDIGITKIIKPITNCGYGTSMNPIVEIKNFGTDTLKTNDTIPIQLKLDGAVVQNDTLFLTSKLDPGTMVQATLSRKPLNLSIGAHTLIVFTAYPADINKLNDTIPLSFRNFQIHGYPTVDLGPDVTIPKLSYTIRPIATSGVTSYKWSDANITDSMVVSLSGKYLVTVANVNGCEVNDSINVRLKVHDLGIKRITGPISSCSLPTTTYINVKLMNFGTDTIATSEDIDMRYRINDTAFYSQTLKLASELRPGDSISYSFSKTVNLSKITNHKIMAGAILAGDIRTTNDSIVQTIQVFGNPHPDLPPSGNKRALKYTLDPGIGFKSYLWQDGSTDTSYVITPIHNNDPNRLYKVWVTDQNGCTGMDSTIIFFQVYDLELTKILLEDACTRKTTENIALKITNKGYNGRVDENITVWYKINNADSISESFKLTANDGISQIYTFIQKANLAAPGTYTITAGLIFGIDVMPENNKTSQIINVYGNPSINFGIDTLRVELPIILDAGAGPGYTYLWNTNELTQTISAPTSGSYSVKVTNSHGCDSTNRVFVKGNIVDLAVSSFIISSKNCKLTSTETVGIRIRNTGNIKLTDQPFTIKYQLDGAAEKTKDVIFNGTPGDSLSFNFDGVEDLSAVKTYAFNTSLVYGIDKVAANNSKDFTVAVFGLPKINDFGATNDTVKLSTWPKVLDPGAGFATYKWQDGSNSSTFSVITKGLYKVTVTDNNGCAASDSVYILNTGIKKLSDQAEMTIYPNPVRDILNVKLNLKKDEPVVIQVLSVNGKVVVSRKLSGFTQYLEQIDVYALPRGIYYIRVSTTEWVVTDKVLVE